MEKTIEERAKSLADWILRREGCLKSSGLADLIKEELEKQRKIDIEKACEWLSERCAFGVHPCGGTALVMEFRKTMEE